MGDISLNFDRSEFACKCGCGFNSVDVELVSMLQMLRDTIGASITINSGCRCPEYNKKVGGVTKSQHLYARAADISVEGFQPAEIYELLDVQLVPPERYGLKKYDTFVHVDSRTHPWRKP